MTPIPTEWIERIFVRLTEIYGDKFISYLGNETHTSCMLILWKNSLIGLTPQEIKHALAVCRDNPLSPIPTPIEFFYIGKKKFYPYKVKPVENHTINKAIANASISNIKEMLSGRKYENKIYT